ncbi:hypothetical protein D3C87_1929430 [compost metagenome]
MIVCPVISSWIVCVCAAFTGVQFRLCRVAEGIAGADVVFCGTMLTSAKLTTGEAANNPVVRQSATRLFFIVMTSDSESMVARQ